MILEKIGYSYNDLTIIPSDTSVINSRSECSPTYNNGKLPLFASCMSTVVSPENYEIWEKNGITPIIPRNVPIETRLSIMELGRWVAVSLTEFRELFINSRGRSIHIHYHICIDIANGHMKSLYADCIEAKNLSNELGYKLSIMTGNIANPKTYEWICRNIHYKDKNGQNKTAVDYIRVGIGTGLGCTTSSNTGIHYPQATLINECYKIKQSLLTLRDDLGEPKYNQALFPKIVADGGIRNFDHVIKALALGTDYIIIGGLFAAMYESASPLMIKTVGDEWVGEHFIEVDYKYENEEKKRLDIKNRQLWKEYYGMSTKKAQQLIDGKKTTKTAEGRRTFERVKYTIQQWTENMKDYMKSAMSYCNCRTLDEFIGKVDLIVNSPGEIAAVNK